MSQQQISYLQITGAGSSNGQVLIANGIGGVNWGYIGASSSTFTYLLDDFSDYFDGITTTFPLTINNGTPVYPSTPQLLNIFIGNVPVKPNRYNTDYLNLPVIKLFNSGYNISGSNIVFATAPLPGMSFSGTYFNSSDPTSNFTYKTTPFTALNIMLGA
jgi:hypothetical protein